ncbi:head GIN domain-containing protein [Cernens ardua]|uniref:head GIN domain-containing protein n=1 Tax=Cernens ardua TaxID=3402176 RepID=UPI003F9A9989
MPNTLTISSIKKTVDTNTKSHKKFGKAILPALKYMVSVAGALVSMHVMASTSPFDDASEYAHTPWQQAHGYPYRKSFTLDQFSSIVTSGSVDIVVFKAPIPQVIVASKHHRDLDKVSIRNRNGTLTIGSNISSGFHLFGFLYPSGSDSTVVAISTPALSRLKNRGSGDTYIHFSTPEALTLSTVGDGDLTYEGDSQRLTLQLQGSGDGHVIAHVEQLVADLSGSGDLKLGGQGNALDLTLNGSGDADTRHFLVPSVTLQSMGSGDAHIYAAETLQGKVMGSGDLTIYGHPETKDLGSNGAGDIAHAR